MILLVMGYVVALSEKLQAEFENFYHPNNSSSDTSLATRRHGDEELHAPDPQDAQQETKKNYRASNRLAVSVAAFLRKFSSPSSSSTVSSTRRCARAQKQQQQQQHSRAPVFAAPSTASDVYPPAATRRGSGATAWARKVRLGSSGIRSAPRVAQQEQGLLPAAAASTRRARLTDKTLCLDLDETLVHARGDVREMGENRFDFMLVFPQRQRHHRQNEQAGPGSQQQQQQCSTAGGGRGRGGKGREAGAEQKEVDGRCKRVFVRKRPHLKEFLEAAAEMFEVVLFTAAPAKFAQAVVEQIDPEGKLVDHVLPRESCTRLRFDGSSSSSSSACGGGRGRGSGERGPASVVKDLEVVGRPLSKVSSKEYHAYILQTYRSCFVLCCGLCRWGNEQRQKECWQL